MPRELKIFAVVVIVITVLLAITSFWNDSVIIDEVPHIGAGYSYLVKQDMRLNPEHPPLAKDLAALPLVLLGLNRDAFMSRFWLADINGQWEFGRQLIFNSGNDADLITHAAKIPMLLFFIASGVLLLIWAYELYGQNGAFIALILFAFSPTVLAHSRLVATDMAALTGVLFATHFFLRYLKEPTARNMIIAEIIFGIALLTKFSTFLLVPFLGLLALIWGWMHGGQKLENRLRSAMRSGWRSVWIMLVGFTVIVWPVYFFHTFNYPATRQHRDTQEILKSFGKRWLADPVVWMSDKPVLRAAGQYGLGLLMVTQRSAGGNTTYFLGEVSRFGWRKYFPIVYFLKEPLAWWILTLIALVAISLQVKKQTFRLKNLDDWAKEHFNELAMLIWLAIYWSLSVKSTLNIGVRHLLPTYPFAILLVSGQIVWLTEWIRHIGKKEFRNFVFLVAALLGWYVFESIHVWPFYLTYFNQIAGGPSGGYRYVVDSNLDWGQDLKRFSQWVEKNNIPKIEFDYFGWADPAYYLSNHYIWLSSKTYRDGRDFINRNHSDGWIAVSATFLQGSIGSGDMPSALNYTWLNAYQPVTVIGHSIFVWHITK